MTRAAALGARVSAGALVLVVAVLAGVSASCGESRVSLGESCLKDEDCLSGICAQQRCASSPPLLDGAGVDSEASGEPGGDGATDSAPIADAPFDASGDQSAGDVAAETGTEAAKDAADVLAEAAIDAQAAGRGDASFDAQSADGAEGG